LAAANFEIDCKLPNSDHELHVIFGMGRSPDAIIAGEQGGRARREYVPYSYLVGWGGVSTIRRIRTVGEKG
jgi:hypothetical protein